MKRRHRLLLLAGCVTAGIISLCTYVSFRWTTACCVEQHKEALGRQIGVAIVEQVDGGQVAVPQVAAYKVRDTWPMNYELHLRSGHRFPLDIAKRTNSVIAYFVARPAYPFWVAALRVAPHSKEVLLLHESLAVFPAPKEKLLELTRDW